MGTTLRRDGHIPSLLRNFSPERTLWLQLNQVDAATLPGPASPSVRLGELEVPLEKIAAAGTLEIVLGEKDLADRVLELL